MSLFGSRPHQNWLLRKPRYPSRQLERHLGNGEMRLLRIVGLADGAEVRSSACDHPPWQKVVPPMSALAPRSDSGVNAKKEKMPKI
jgi:hypothetical protein